MTTMTSRSTKRSIFVFAHQDDEFGVFLEIEKKIKEGEQVLVVYLTSGDLAGAGAPQRNSESVQVLSRLGVPEGDIHFLGTALGIPDGKLIEHLALAWRGLDNIWIQAGGANEVFVLAWEGGHQDHDAAHVLGVALADRHGLLDSCFQFCLYTGRGLRGSFFRLFAPDAKNGPQLISRVSWCKRLQHLRYVWMYPSQWKTWGGLYPFFLWHHLFWGTQVLQRVSLKRLKERPHAGLLLYERRGFYSYQDSSNFVRSFLQDIYGKFE